MNMIDKYMQNKHKMTGYEIIKQFTYFMMREYFNVDVYCLLYRNN